MENEAKFNLKPGLIATALILVAMLALSAVAWFKLPEGQPIATHWGISGQPDAYSSKTTALLMLPIIMLIESGVFVLVTQIEPRRRNIKLSSKGLTAIWIASISVMLIIHAFVIMTALGWKVSVSSVMSAATGLLFIVIGNYLPKLRSNFFAGIRTPWTLSSELAWSRTHRLGGKLFILYGLALIIAGFLLKSMALFLLLIVGVFAITIFLMVYSYIVWKSDPNKIGANGETPSGGSAGSKKTLLAVVLVSVAVAGVCAYALWRLQPPSDVKPAARAVVHAIINGDYEAATKDFDPTMKAGLPPERLESTWESMTAKMGPFEKVLGIRTERSLPFTIVYVTCKFERETAVFKVVFGSSGKISGLWITPPG